MCNKILLSELVWGSGVFIIGHKKNIGHGVLSLIVYKILNGQFEYEIAHVAAKTHI